MSPTSATAASPRAAHRIQYRVGHGGFHATIVENATAKAHLVYVYDVGAKPNKSELLLAIELFIDELSSRKITRVDYIFLSHIDGDHVNGLRELLDALAAHAPKIVVANVVLPWLSPVQKLLTQSRNNHRQPTAVVTNLAGSDESADLFLNGLGVENVIRITAEGEDGAPTATSTTIPSGASTIAARIPGWLLLPIKTPTPPTFEASFRTELGNRLPNHLNPNSPSDHHEILTDHKSEILDAIKAVAHLIGVTQKRVANWSSLALLHGSTTPTTPCAVSIVPPQHIDVQCEHGWLHTGDLPVADAAVWANLSSELQSASVKSPLCVVVAPHHGSGLDHNDALYADATPGTVILTTGRKLTGVNAGKPSYSYNLGKLLASAGSIGANVVELNNV